LRRYKYVGKEREGHEAETGKQYDGVVNEKYEGALT
jgi:hypothetical protein